MRSSIVGVGHYLPPVVETVGVRRPIEKEPVGASTLAARAVPNALAQTGATVDAIDFIVFATWTPDVVFPGSGCYLQDQLGCGTVGTVDVRAQCAGFLFGLSVADQFVRTGQSRNVLVAAAEVHSAGLDYSDRGAKLAALFADGAGVALVGNAPEGRGLKAIALHSDGSRHRQFWCEYPASRQHPVRMTLDDFRQGKHYPTMDFEAVRQFGAETLPDVVSEVLRKTDLSVHGVDRFIVGHVFPEVAEGAARQLGIPASRLDVPAARHGHLAAAALPVALSEAVAAGEVGAGSTVCLAACGAGFAWGAAVLSL